jgi:hypothetical protein
MGRAPIGRILLLSFALTAFIVVAAFTSLPGLAIAAIVSVVVVIYGLAEFTAARKALRSGRR